MLASVVLMACPGDLKNVERFPEGPLPDCAGDLDVVNDIFARHCGTDSCHEGESPEADLNLLDGNAFDNLYAVESTECDGHLRIDPDDVRSSFLLDKLRGPTAIPPGCGDSMPLLSRLDGNQIACVERWVIENIEARRDGGVPLRDAAADAPADTGTDGGADVGVDAGVDMGVDVGPADPCGPIDGNADFALCERSADSCAGEFLNMNQCSAFCAAAGLVCTASYENIGLGDCMFDMAMPLNCEDRGHMADYCVCGRP